jgi:hypothetical protein
MPIDTDSSDMNEGMNAADCRDINEMEWKSPDIGRNS